MRKSETSAATTGDRRPIKTLERVLSKAGLGSRSQARSWIGAGRVRVNGKVLQNPDHWVDLERDKVTLDGKLLRAQERIYILLYKPAGYVTTYKDPEGRPTVYDLIGDAGVWVAPVGRLDLETSGLLILTNDTQFAERLTNPAYKVPKTYEVKAAHLLRDEQLQRLRQGVELSDGITRPALVGRLRDTGRHTHLEMTITEGRNRQVRRMLEAVDSKVLKLVRTAIGPIRIGSLAIGKWRTMTEPEVEELQSGVAQNRGKLMLHVSHPRESSTDERLGNRPHARPPGPRNSGKKRRSR
jgi:23S rRNA pseudouridine2605 synthase